MTSSSLPTRCHVGKYRKYFTFIRYLCYLKKLQIVLWHIPGKIEKVEAVVVYTAAQIKHRITIKTLIAWMQEVLDTSVIRPTAISSLKKSQKAAVIQIKWISPYDQIDSSGRITSLPEEVTDSTDDLSLQFVTASEDGTIAFWDLKLNEKLVFFCNKFNWLFVIIVSSRY